MVRCAIMAILAFPEEEVSRPLAAPQYAHWQAALADAVRDPVELCRLLGLDAPLAAAAKGAAGRFPLLVPRPYLARIRPGDPEDPLLLQVLPRVAERIEAPGYLTDPLGEAEALVAPGLLAKYRGRSLIVAAGACAVHCRFCFRRHFPYNSSPDSAADWGPALRQIAGDASTREVILSGGDPLAMPDASLARLARRLGDVPHLRRLRVHTRLPVMIPQRVTDELLGWLCGGGLSARVVVHVNHPAEIDPSVAGALGRLVDAGIPVLQQAVLLRGVNDRIEILAELYERLIDIRVAPYYLHQLDPVAGAAHFEVAQSTGVRLIRQLRTRLPGYAVPRYVRETPGGLSKEVLA
ncbi:MAG: EF-P beta-lysylation protein EpmB [Pirellulales bacterium]|nr:EF-P beta-lysylation protein EpmB [Pirellulales bacterium]